MYLIAFLDKSMHTEKDAEVCLNLPVLATVPLLDVEPAVANSGLLTGALKTS